MQRDGSRRSTRVSCPPVRMIDEDYPAQLLVARVLAKRAVCSRLIKRILKNAREMYDAALENGRMDLILRTLTDYVNCSSSVTALSFKCGDLIDRILDAPQRHAVCAADLQDIAEEMSLEVLRFNRMNRRIPDN